MEIHIGVFGILCDNKGRVLLCHRRDVDLWNLPGGHLEQNESPWDGVLREIKEETGLDARVERLAGVYYKPLQNEIAFSFVCSIVSGRIAVNKEADRIEYFAEHEFPGNLSPKQVERIHDALTNPTTVICKTQRSKSSRELLREGKL
ncbi:MAG: NUDIX domain-containing protein [Patescibacteria group bacterium]|jgi:ADP-ribose pyrophosphatase YjhB (NUDIX family)